MGKVSELSSSAAQPRSASSSTASGTGNNNNNNSGAGSTRGVSTKSIEEGIPDEIRDILEKLDNEGVMLLSMSEIMRLKTHIANQTHQNRAQQSEKTQLTLEIYKLRDLLADIKNLNQLCTSVEESDWRAGIIRAISEIFLNQKEHLLTELSSFVASVNNNNKNNNDSPSSTAAAVQTTREYLENKIADLVSQSFGGIYFLIFDFIIFI